jgi:hypothetical protein
MQSEPELEGAYRLANNSAIEPQHLFDVLAESAADRARVPSGYARAAGEAHS